MTISKPSVTINLVPANETVSTGPQKVLIIGQKLTEGTASAGVLVEDIGNDNSWDDLFGDQSMIASMVRAFRRINKVTRLDAIPVADATGTNASAAVSFSGTATATTKFYVSVGGTYDYKLEVVVTNGDTADTIASALTDAINDAKKLAYTAAFSSGICTVTYIHTGEEGNYSNIRVEGSIPGVTITLAGFSGGATQPVLSTVFNLVQDERYQTIVWPTSYNRAIVLNNFLDGRFNVNNIILDGVMIQTAIDTKANLKTLGNSLNSQSAVITGLKGINDPLWKGNGAQEAPYVISSYIAALRSLRLTEGSNLTNYVTTTTGSLDTIGGPAIASLPYFNTPLDFITNIPVGKSFSPAEVDELANAGISSIGNNRSNNTVILGDLVTTYKTDNAGNEDLTFKYLNNVDVASTTREYFSNNIRKQYSQCRLTEGDLVPNRSMANAASIGGFLDQLYNEASGTGLVLLQRGEAARNFFKTNRTITLNLKLGQALITMQVPIVTQLRDLTATMQIAFSTNS